MTKGRVNGIFMREEHMEESISGFEEPYYREFKSLVEAYDYAIMCGLTDPPIFYESAVPKLPWRQPRFMGGTTTQYLAFLSSHMMEFPRANRAFTAEYRFRNSGPYTSGYAQGFTDAVCFMLSPDGRRINEVGEVCCRLFPQCRCRHAHDPLGTFQLPDVANPVPSPSVSVPGSSNAGPAGHAEGGIVDVLADLHERSRLRSRSRSQRGGD